MKRVNTSVSKRKRASVASIFRRKTSNSRKKEKKNGKSYRVEEEDRLSKLPDEIIHRILSGVDAKLAVQTSVLSKRWRYLWTSLPVLNFDESSFKYSPNFEYFVDKFLSCRDASTNVFNINFECCDELDDGRLVDSIIDYVTDTPVICTSIQVLNISAVCVVGNLPQLCMWRSLITLSLCHISTETTCFKFPSLQYLYLWGCKFQCGRGNSFDQFKGCAKLKYLYFHDCDYYGEVKNFKISAPYLTNLNISGFRADERFEDECVIELFTPRLQYFTYCDSVLYDFSTEINLFSVKKVDIDISWLPKNTSSVYRLMDLFEIMQRAKFISLSADIIKVLSMFPGAWDNESSPFTRMQTFELINGTSVSSDIPRNVKTYLFGESPQVDEGAKGRKKIH